MIAERSSLRAGFSLLEILLATSMLAVALAALTQLSSIGRKHLTAAAKQAVAARLASNQMARIVAGIDPLEDREERPLLEDPDWECKVALKLVAGGDLVEVEVGVRPVDETGSDATTQTKPWFTSARWIALTESMPWRDAPGGPLALAPSSVETLP